MVNQEINYIREANTQRSSLKIILILNYFFKRRFSGIMDIYCLFCLSEKKIFHSFIFDINIIKNILKNILEILIN